MFNKIKKFFKRKEKVKFEDLLNKQCPSCDKIMKDNNHMYRIDCCDKFVHCYCHSFDLRRNDGKCPYCNTQILIKMNRCLLWAILI